jgi:hypothetical protein
MRYGGLLLLALLLCLTMGYVVSVGLAAAIAVLSYAVWKFADWIDRCLERRDRRRDGVRLRSAAVAFRAEAQHAQVAADDARGIYGNYPPAI